MQRDRLAKVIGKASITSASPVFSSPFFGIIKEYGFLTEGYDKTHC